MMTYKYPKSFWKIAEEIGHGRSVVNKDIMENCKRFDRGEKNKHVDTIGILGELIVIDYLTNKGTEFESGRLLDYKPSKAEDVIIKEKRYDIKASTNKYNSLLVNEEAHKKGKGKIDYYWFVKLIGDNEAQFHSASYESVNEWEVKFMGYTNAYKKEL